VPDSEAVGGERAKLLDFGIAKLASGELSDAGGPQLTATGVSLGTPSYMAPEQCDAKPQLTDRLDVYSLGIILYEILVGERPFQSDSMGGLLRQHLLMPPPELPIPASSGLNLLIQQMLAKRPLDRPSMREVITRIEALHTGPLSGTLPSLGRAGQPAPPPSESTATVPTQSPTVVTGPKSFSDSLPAPTARPNRLALGGGLLLVALLCIGGGRWLLHRPTVTPTPVSTVAATPTGMNTAAATTAPVQPQAKAQEAASLAAEPVKPSVPPSPTSSASGRSKHAPTGSSKINLFQDRPKKRLGVH
jgi:serine/threonine protein kinase